MMHLPRSPHRPGPSSQPQLLRVGNPWLPTPEDGDKYGAPSSGQES